MGNRSSRVREQPRVEIEVGDASRTAPAAPGFVPPTRAQGQVQAAFASTADWESVSLMLREHPVIAEHYRELLDAQSDAESKLLEVRTLVPLAKAAYARKPGALPAKRTGVLTGYKNFADKKGIDWRTNAAALEARGTDVWEAERAALRKPGLRMSEYYLKCYEGPLHSYNEGNGNWMAAFDAPSAYLLVHLHHYPALNPQQAFDALHEEFGRLTLKHLLAGEGRPLRCVDIGCGVGTSTFSTVRSLEAMGRTGSVTGVDLSDYFVTVAEHLRNEREAERNGSVDLRFVHGDGLDLEASGFGPGSLDCVVVSEVTHEMPKVVSERLFKEVARVLAPGGVLGYLDLNPAQILKENAVGNLVDRIASGNEPYFDEYLELDAAAAMRDAGLVVREETWPHHAKYATLESCSLRILVARKPMVLDVADWTGKWALDRRENWGPYLGFLGVPEAAQEAATKAPDFHEYVITRESFFMHHRIPAQSMHLRFNGFFDDEWQVSPYPKPTAAMFDKDTQLKDEEGKWKHRWIKYPTSWETTIPDFAGKGKTVTLLRELWKVDEMRIMVHVLEPQTESVLVGPSYSFFKRTSIEPPQNVAAELKERFATGISRSLEWRQQAIDRLGALVCDNVEAWSAAQEADHVSPSSFMGASMMTKGAIAYYKACLASWAAPQPKDETLPPFMQTEGDWEVIPEPKGVGLVIAPWNAPVLLCALPALGMLAAGNLCVMKPSEAAPHVSRLLARLVPKYFPDRSLVVAEGGRETVEQLINNPVDHILFTGGGVVAKKIMALASRHLTPVSLELGGKNPVFIDVAEQPDLELYVAEIVGTKFYFGGQFCQAPDYCLVMEDVYDEFVRLVEAKITALGPGRNCRMINSQHAGKVKAMLQGHEHVARPPLPQDTMDEDRVPLTALLLEHNQLDCAVMRDEIFGPLMPILKVKSAQEAAVFVSKRPKPLVAYCYSPKTESLTEFRDKTSSGNLAGNCGPQRMQSNFNVGFGGVGDSGFGHSIWGRAAFDDYSHHKTVFRGKKFGGSVWGASPPPAKGAGKGANS